MGTVRLPWKTRNSQWGKAPGAPEDIQFLRGPQKRSFELWRAIRIFGEFLRGFRTLHFVGPCVTVFGSARFPETHPYYVVARQLGARLARAGFTVMTGGGPGIMEAANRGAKEVGGRSVGCNIELPQEQAPNPYLDEWMLFRHFYVRKVMLVKYSYAFVAMPGGFGTLDEIFETMVLIQTHKIKDFPMILMPSQFWNPILEAFRHTLLERGTIDAVDFGLVRVTDSPEEAIEHILKVAMSDFGLSYVPKPRKRWFFFE
ncbi:MAG: TIGR00730 family Rossman fold protein [bacterium]